VRICVAARERGALSCRKCVKDAGSLVRCALILSLSRAANDRLARMLDCTINKKHHIPFDNLTNPVYPCRMIGQSQVTRPLVIAPHPFTAIDPAPKPQTMIIIGPDDHHWRFSFKNAAVLPQ
jgi:hypothetical protein